jgi:peptide deformylase
MKIEKPKEEKKQEPVDFLKNYVAPHNKKSREVKEEDLEVVVRDAHILYNLCFTQRGPYCGGFAVAHPQINDEDPLSFFVTSEKEIIINPVITNHTKVFIKSEEGCLSFPDRLEIDVDRYNKCTVKYKTLKFNGDGTVVLSEEMEENLSGKRSKIFQHELQHFLGKNIYDNL